VFRGLSLSDGGPLSLITTARGFLRLGLGCSVKSGKNDKDVAERAAAAAFMLGEIDLDTE
jgi:hypothetical protein